jgi:hypothetical protein
MKPFFRSGDAFICQVPRIVGMPEIEDNLVSLRANLPDTFRSLSRRYLMLADMLTEQGWLISRVESFLVFSPEGEGKIEQRS